MILPTGRKSSAASQRSLTSNETVCKTVAITSLTVWLPHMFALLWVSFGHSLQRGVLTALCASALVGVTLHTATRREGDWLMLLAGVVGLIVELSGFGISDDPEWELSRRWWTIISAMHGVISGLLCKAKDRADGRYFEHHTIAERLYVVAPFTIGQWVGFILLNGWAGVLKVFSSIFLCLAAVGYGVVGCRIMDYFGVRKGDLLSLVAKLFTTSFGVVFGTLSLTVCFVFYLAIPYMVALSSLNALVSSAGILIEVILYEVA